VQISMDITNLDFPLGRNFVLEIYRVRTNPLRYTEGEYRWDCHIKHVCGEKFDYRNISVTSSCHSCHSSLSMEMVHRACFFAELLGFQLDDWESVQETLRYEHKVYKRNTTRR